MEAATLNCPMCGAPSASEATSCAHCGARLAKVACPSCFGMLFTGSKFCPHCGTKADRAEESGDKPRPCPRCKTPLAAITLSTAKAHECPRCSGLWVDTETFNEICADREKQSAVIAQYPEPVSASEWVRETIRYSPCPKCARLMNRINFAHGSGVILDICKPDGVWFDKDELRRIIEFIRAGGLDLSRERDREEWEAEKRKAKLAPVAGGAGGFDVSPSDWHRTADTGSLLIEVLAAVARMLFRL